MTRVEVKSNGEIWDASYGGRCYGRVTSDGSIYDDRFSGSQIGRVNSEGTVYDNDGSVVGRINSNGTVFDDGHGGSEIGQVESGSLAGGGIIPFLLPRSKVKEKSSGYPLKTWAVITVVIAVIYLFESDSSDGLGTKIGTGLIIGVIGAGFICAGIVKVKRWLGS